MRVDRPWGFFETILEGDGFKVKRIVVNPNQRLSLQSHKHRTEAWTITKGFGCLQVGNHETLVFPGNTRIIYKNEKHRVTADKDGLEFVEVQTGEVLDENDITRYADDYGRAES